MKDTLLSTLLQKIIDGYKVDVKKEVNVAIETWTEALNLLEEVCTVNQINTIEDLDSLFANSGKIHDWIVDFDVLLGNAIVKILRLCDFTTNLKVPVSIRFRLNEFFVNLSNGEDIFYQEHMRNIAETHFFIKEFDKGIEIFEDLKNKHYYNVWNYIVYADMYSFYSFLPNDFDKAKSILLEAKEHMFHEHEVEVLVERIVDARIKMQSVQEKQYKNEIAKHVMKIDNVEQAFEYLKTISEWASLNHINYILEHREEAIKVIEKEMKNYHADPDKYANDHHFLSVFLPCIIAELELEGYSKMLIDIACGNDDQTWDRLGDLLTEAYELILYKVFDGDIACLMTKVEDTSVDIFAREKLLLVLALTKFESGNEQELLKYFYKLGVITPELIPGILDAVLLIDNENNKSKVRDLQNQFRENTAINSKHLSEEFSEYTPFYSINDFKEKQSCIKLLKRSTSYFKEYKQIEEDDLFKTYTRYFNDCIIDMEEVARDMNEPIEIPKVEKGIIESTDAPVKSVKIGRNDPCPCGSGKKYKKCCRE